MALVLLLSTPAPAADEKWSKPYPGVRHLVSHSTGPIEAHAVLVDLEEPGISVRASRRGERWQTVREFAVRAGCAVALNGGFWTMLGQGPAGVAAGGGRPWPGARDDEDHGFFALTRRGRPWISRPGDVLDPLPRRRVGEAVSGRPMILERGRPARELADFPFRRFRHPRTAVGISRDRRRLVLIAVDGRQPHSKGMNIVQLAHFARSLGAWTAINLDGGGSTTLWIAAEGGLVNRPCRGERTVLNHLCVLQPRGPTEKPPSLVRPEGALSPTVSPALVGPTGPPPSLRPSLLREHWGLLSVLATALVLWAATRRWVRNRTS